jgi:hypothetical protein
MRASSEQMKFYLGYILSQGDDLLNEIGLNPWVVNEGRADARDAHEVDLEIVQKYGLTYSGATEWFNRNYLNKENAPRGVMKYYLVEVYFCFFGDGEVRDTRTILFKSKRDKKELTDEFLCENLPIGKLNHFELIEINLEELGEI